MRRPALAALSCLVLLACGGDDSSPETDAAVDVSEDAPDADVSGDTAPDDVPGDDTDATDASADDSDATGDASADTDGGGDTDVAAPDAADADTTDADAEDAGPDPWPVAPSLEPYAARPETSTLPESVESCAVIAEERCEDATLRRCALYDGGAADWAADVPPMTEQAFWFDRYFDLYHAPGGLSMDVDFVDAVLAGTPESEWSRPEHFRRYDGRGDSSGWTGTALWGAAARYAVTGTEADYARMLDRTEAVTFLYEVTSVPGMLARSHYAMLEEGAPEPRGHWGKLLFSHHAGDGTDGHFALPIDEALHDRLPDYYLDGVEIDGTHYDTTPVVQYDTSRDQYVRGLPGLMLAHDLLGEGEREDTIRATLQAELPCTLNRMRRGRIYNLQDATDILEAVTTYFGAANLTLDDDDMDFGALDELIFYVLEQPHPDHLDAFDVACPDGPPMEVDPALEYDASDPFFLFEFAALAARETGGGDVPVAFSMHVSVRASDTIFMTQWALTAHALTDDERYLEFVAQLMAEVDYWGVLGTYGAFQLPKWCAPHYGPSLGYPSLYNLQARIDRAEFPEYWNALAEVARIEARQKENGPREDAFFGILYNRMVDAATDPTAAEYVATSVAQLATYGMNPEDKLEPDRSYPRNFVDRPDPDVPLEEIGLDDPEWAICEEPTFILGIEVPAPRIDGIPVRSVDPLPLPKRIGGTFLWQMDPWMVQREYGGVGMDTQWPMLGMFTPYWVGRMDGAIAEGGGLALGWRDTGEACEL